MSNYQKTPVLTTVHGSRLYGLNHAQSDEDTYTVFTGVRKNYANQTMVGKADDFQVSLDKFLRMCQDGVPQALEAMFSPFAQMSPAYEPFFRSYQMGATESLMRYRRTVRNFGSVELEDGTFQARDDFKRRRHSLRLCFGLSDGLRYGRFNPHLTPQQIAMLNERAALEGDAFLETMENMLGAAMIGSLSL